MKDIHLPLLRSFDELAFNLGRKALSDFLKGNPNSTIEKHHLDELESYGVLYKYDLELIRKLITALLKEGYIEEKLINGTFRVLQRTMKGSLELQKKEFEFKPIGSLSFSLKHSLNFHKITEEERKIFEQFSFFLEKFNEEQKLAIISDSSHLLCVAGAGTGKTTVLTKRIEFLTKFKSIDSKKILAITFTRKARDEMKERLEKLEVQGVRVETFNSFSERILRKYEQEVFGEERKVLTFRDKIVLVRRAMEKTDLTLDHFAEEYFTKKQLRESSQDELFFVLMNDLFSVVDSFKNRMEEMDEFYERETGSDKKRVAKIIWRLASALEEELEEGKLRDFSDQILYTLRLFKKASQKIPYFEHILVDEYQDLNLIQSELLKLLGPENLFAVGDPRQAIYGWRGSDISFILDFPKTYPNSQCIALKKNYRSRPEVIQLANRSVKKMGLEDLETIREKSSEKVCHLVSLGSEEEERLFVCDAIRNSNVKGSEIFVLARTNRILEKMAEIMQSQKIPYAIKGEEEFKEGELKEDQVVLATVHAIKGMEAEEVYVLGVNSLSFPNKVQDNAIFALLKETDEKEKIAEEQRLFYVALTRAKEKLVLTYTGNPSYFIDDEMLLLLKGQKNMNHFTQSSSLAKKSESSVLLHLLKQWRSQKARERGIASYMVLSNDALEELVRHRPQSLDEFVLIKGMGPAKISQYGQELLKYMNG